MTEYDLQQRFSRLPLKTKLSPFGKGYPKTLDEYLFSDRVTIAFSDDPKINQAICGFEDPMHLLDVLSVQFDEPKYANLTVVSDALQLLETMKKRATSLGRMDIISREDADVLTDIIQLVQDLQNFRLNSSAQRA